MRALFDVNMLLVLFDQAHELRPRALAWWLQNEQHGWASCPITQNGFVRIISQPTYVRPKGLLEAVALLADHAGGPGHEFWCKDVSFLDRGVIDHTLVLGHRQITDVYLLALAVAHGGRLVTFDRKVPLRAVKGATAEHCVVV